MKKISHFLTILFLSLSFYVSAQTAAFKSYPSRVPGLSDSLYHHHLGLFYTSPLSALPFQPYSANLSKWAAYDTAVKVNLDYFTAQLALKQALLVSGTNIKTINGSSILGSGNLVISTGSKLDTSLASGYLFIGNTFGKATGVAQSGDGTFSNSGVFSIGSLKVMNSMLNGGITYSKLSLTGAILNTDLANSTTTINGTSIALGASGTITAAPSGSAGGALSGTYPNPTLSSANLNKWALLDTVYATTSRPGRLSYTDWNTFNGKQAGSSNLTKWSLLDTVYATSTRNGRLSFTDWNTFNNKVSSQWVTTGSDIYYSTGGVMVGQASAPSAKLHTVDVGTSSPRGIILDQYNTGTNSSQANLRKARGTFASPTTIVTGDVLSNINTWSHDGVNFLNSAAIRVTSVGSVTTGRTPTKMDFYTMTDPTGVLTLAMTLDQSQNAIFAGASAVTGTGGLGYYRMVTQSSPPAAVNGSMIMYSNSNNAFTLLKRNIANSGDIKRTLVFPDFDITVNFPIPSMSGTDTVDFIGTAQTITGIKKYATAPKFASGIGLQDNNGVNLISFPSTVSSAVNYLVVTNSATNTTVGVSTAGTDANIDMTFTPKGSGKSVFSTTVNAKSSYAPLATTLTPSGTTQTIDWSNGNNQVLSLASASGNVTLTFSNAQTGAVYNLKIVQGASNRNVTFPSGTLWNGGLTYVPSTATSAVDLISIFVDGSGSYLNAYSKNFQ